MRGTLRVRTSRFFAIFSGTLACFAFVAMADAALPPKMSLRTMKVVAPRALGPLDPSELEDPFDASVSRAVFSTLYRGDAAGSIRPELARTLPILREGAGRDGEARIVEIELRRGVLLHDRSELTAHVVKASLERAANVAEASWLLAAFETERSGWIRATDRYTLRLRTHHDPITTAKLLSSVRLGITKRGREGFVSAGPFRPVMRNETLRLLQFDASPSGAPYLGAIEFRAPATATAIERAFQLGQIDGFFSTSAASSLLGQARRDAGTFELPSSSIILLVPGPGMNPSAASDSESTVSAAWQALGAALGNLDDVRLSYVGLRQAPFQWIERVVSADRNRGVPQPTRLRLGFRSNDPRHAAIAELIVALMDERGVRVDLVPHAGRWNAAIARGSPCDVRIEEAVFSLNDEREAIAATFAAAQQFDEARSRIRNWTSFVPTSAIAGLKAFVLGSRREIFTHDVRASGFRVDANQRLLFEWIHWQREVAR